MEGRFVVVVVLVVVACGNSLRGIRAAGEREGDIEGTFLSLSLFPSFSLNNHSPHNNIL